MPSLQQSVDARVSGNPVTEAPKAPQAEVVQQRTELARERQQSRQEFRDRQVSRLQSEREGSLAPVSEEVEPVAQDSDQPARQPEEDFSDAEAEGAVAQEASEEATPDDENGSPELEQDAEESLEASEELDDEDLGPNELSVRELRQEIDSLQSDYAELERGFRQKTHRLGESQRNLQAQMQDVETQAAFYASLAEQGLQAYNNINWDSLKSQPDQYQKAAREYQQAVDNRDKLMQGLERVREENAKRKELFDKQQASLSRDMLATEIKGWNRERYSELRDYAVNKSGLFTEEEFAESTDWRVIKLLDIAERRDRAPKDVGKLRKKQSGKTAPVGRQANKPRVDPVRDTQGRFASAKAALRQNPGDRNARREFFVNKLQAERVGG